MKKIPFPKSSYEKSSKMFSIMGHPVRLMILDLLRHNDEMSVKDMQSVFELPKANISQHLAELRRPALVNAQRQGRNKIYSLAHPDIADLCRILHHICNSKPSMP